MDVLLIAFLTLLNAGFAMAEMALAASRKARLTAMAESGDKGAQTALRLLANPTQFLSTVQVGITSIGMLNGIVGEAAFSDGLAEVMMHWGLPARSAGPTATVVVVVIITFITILFGELVPKRIGQMYPEPVARWVALPMAGLARVARPFVAALSATTLAVLRLLRIDINAGHRVTEEEINASLEEGVGAGIIEEHEHQMVRNVFLLDDRQLASIMVPRSDIEWLEAGEPLSAVLAKVGGSGHSWYPVCRGGLDHVVGVVHLPRLMVLAQSGAEDVAWDQEVIPAVFVPETVTGMELLEQFRARAMRMVFVVDEYGVVQGMVTPLDLLEAITGELSTEKPVDAWAVEREDGTWLLDGAMPVQELKARLDIDELPDEDKGRYNTVAGLMQYAAGELMSEQQSVDVAGWRLQVLAKEGRRIERVLMQRCPPLEPTESHPS